MKKILICSLFSLFSLLLIFELTGCNKDINFKDELTVEINAFSGDDNSIKYTDFLNEDKETSLIPNKLVLVELILIIENKESEDRTFKPIITISNTQGYEFNKKTNNFTLTPENEGMPEEGQRIHDITIPVKAGTTESMKIEFYMRCRKPINGGHSVSQKWIVSENNVIAYEKQYKYKVPDIKDEIQYNEDNFYYENNEIIFEKPKARENETINCFYAISEETVLKRPEEKDGKYYIIVNKTGEYTITFTSSELSREDFNKKITCKKLDAPSDVGTRIGDNGAELFWVCDTKEEKTVSYEISCDGNTINTTENKYFLLDELAISEAGEHKITIKATSSDSMTFASVPSNTYIIFKLDKPVISKSGSMVEWDPVSRAQKYQIYINDEYQETISETSYSLSGLYGKRIKVVAISMDSNVIASEKSKEITSTIL